MFDSKFSNVLFRTVASTGAAFDMTLDPTNSDCTNNIMFSRCHFENSTGATTPGGGAYIRGHGGTATAAQHGRLFFDGCHFETGRYDIGAFNLENCNNIEVNGQILQSSALTNYTDAVSLIRLINVNGFAVTGGSTVVARDAVSATWGHKLLSLGGTTTAVTLSDAYVVPNTGTPNEGMNIVWESDATTPFVDVAGGQPLVFGAGVAIGNRGEITSSNAIVGLTSAISRNCRWAMSFGETNQDLRFHFSNDNTWLGTSNPNMQLTNDGVLSVKSGIKGYGTGTVATGVTKTFNIAVSGNSARIGLYIIVSHDSAALIYSNGSSLSVLQADTNFWAVGNTDPNLAARTNVYLTSTSLLTITNRTGATKRYSVLTVGLHAGL